MGLEPHYIVHTSPGNAQAVLKIEPERLGKRNRERLLEQEKELRRDLAQLLRADPHYQGLLARLPGSLREVRDGIWTVGIEHHSDHAPFEIGYLRNRVDKAQKRPRSTWRGYRVIGQATGRVWDCPAIRWLRERTIAIGSRNAAATALGLACTLDKIPEAEAERRLLSWRLEHTERGLGNDGRDFTDRDVLCCTRSLYRHHADGDLGLDPQRLIEIRDTTGQSMPLQVARTVLTAMPNAYPAHQPLPLRQLRNKPFIWTLSQVLGTWLEQARLHGTVTLITTAKATAASAGVSTATVTNMLWPAVKSLGIAKHIITNSGNATEIDLRKIAPHTPHKLIAFVRPPHNEAHSRNLWCYLCCRFQGVVNRLISLISSIVSWVRALLADAPLDEGADGPLLAPMAGERSDGGRDPPDRGGEAENRLDSNVAGGGSVIERAWEFAEQVRTELLGKGLGGREIEEQVARAYQAALKSFHGPS